MFPLHQDQGHILTTTTTTTNHIHTTGFHTFLLQLKQSSVQ